MLVSPRGRARLSAAPDGDVPGGHRAPPPPASEARGHERLALAVVVVAYLAVYAWLLLDTAFLPYVVDNNESFSAYTFSYNLLHFPIARSFGLADEALGPNPEAHPFVYTHGGNFPRVFTTLLYLIGAESPQSQIVITTFTIGIVSLLLGYCFFRTLAGPLFAAIACLVLLSDYVLFAQWQVNTWRVWHGVLFFGAFFAVYGMGKSGRRWRWLALAISACLLYLELIFAAFVLTFATLYAAWLYRRRPRTAVACGTWMGMGAGAALAVLTVQRIGYLGWDGMLTDTHLTYFARLGQTGGASALEPIRAFYGSRHVAFWYNLVDPRAFGSVPAFFRGLFHYSFEVATPIFTLVVLALLAGWLAGLVAVAPIRAQDGFLPARDRDCRLTRPQPGQATGPEAWTFVKSGLLLASWCALLLVVFSGELVLGRPPAAAWRFILWDGSARSAVLAMVAGPLASCAVARLATGHWWGFRRLPLLRVAITVCLLLGVMLFVRWQYRLYDENSAALWLGVVGAWLPLGLAQCLVGVAAGLASAMSLVGSRRLLGLCGAVDLTRVGVFLACGSAAYALVYALAAGYVMTGYVTRYAPLLVFVVDVAVAVALYAAVVLTAGSVRVLRVRWRAGAMAAASAPRASRGGLAAVVSCVPMVLGSGSVLLFLVAYWAHAQLAYVAALPPSLFTFLPSLARPPYVGASFVVNNYAAPAAAFTGQWAYYDPTIAGGVSKAGYIVARDTETYLWLADRDTDSAYLEPDYFLCLMPENPSSAAFELNHQGRPVERCSALPLVREAERNGSFPHRLMARDESGHDAWAIVKLDPAYLLPQGERGAPTPEGDVALGANWYAYEVYVGESFRWANNDAEIIATAPTGAARQLRLELEPGPGLGGRPLVLQVLDDQEHVVSEALVSGRQVLRLSLPLAPGATAAYRLHVADGGGLPTPGDPRTLNFRVFAVDWSAP